ncbi:hypothetical protein [Thalassobellus suaedae]|uniref:Membrane or secreted protein n=1 Tax=Thalassobellus suaedae TaxID=3074124 RepID=A0ABY9XWI0_9FLAO|nr:hypothetical protein RHP51_06480 [Flavobacteriaceae bacterium HL-DH14]
MKKIVIFFSIFGLLALHSCTPKTDVNALLKDTETKNEIFDAIAENHDYMMGFIENMRTNNHAMQMMQGNENMMGTMMQGKGMQMMINDSTMMGNMMQMMHKNGMMSDACMQEMMQMMSTKAMWNNTQNEPN